MTTTMRPSRQAPFFVAHGFAVLAPMRRGRGASDGAHEEREGPCEPGALGPGLARAIEDVDAAMAYLRAQPWADSDRVLIGGQSRGGILSVAHAAERPGMIQAVINFAGGWTGDRCDGSGDSFNESTFAMAGRRTRVPVLWLYAEGDQYYSADSIRRYHRAFAQAARRRSTSSPRSGVTAIASWTASISGGRRRRTSFGLKSACAPPGTASRGPSLPPGPRPPSTPG